VLRNLRKCVEGFWDSQTVEDVVREESKWEIEAILMRKEVAIISVMRNERITIPEDVRKELGISDGDKIKVELQIEENKKSIVITRI
jgi:hypothetical protein